MVYIVKYSGKNVAVIKGPSRRPIIEIVNRSRTYLELIEELNELIEDDCEYESEGFVEFETLEIEDRRTNLITLDIDI